MYKILIADDEPIECRALEHKINKYFDNLQLIDSVYNGIELLNKVEQYHPDILIVDINMPGLSGVEVIEILKIKKINCKIIIHTAYSDFMYAKKALQLGADDYLLKPETDEIIRNSISNICKKLDEEKICKMQIEEKQEVFMNFQDIVVEKWLLSLFLEQPDSVCYRLILSSCKELEHGGFFTAWRMISTDLEPELDWNEVQKIIINYLKKFSICVHMTYKEVLYIFIIPGIKEDYKAWFSEIASYIYKELGKKSIQVATGISLWKNGEEMYVQGIQEARITLQNLNKGIMSFFHYGKQKKETKKILLDKVVESAFLLLEGKEDVCLNNIIENIHNNVENDILDKDKEVELKVEGLIYLHSVQSELYKLSAKTDKNELNMWKKFRDISNIMELEEWIKEGIRYCYNLVHNKDVTENIYISKANLYIQSNYNIDISLEEVSEAVGISSFYLSRLLKQEKNTTFTEIVTNLRIWRSILLMKESNKAIKEIAIEVGYPNITYFYKVFRKTTGMSVGTMRQFLIEM